ncbi:hypothetical protein BKA93DRAFT_824597 [Sparassis latifolia]
MCGTVESGRVLEAPELEETLLPRADSDNITLATNHVVVVIVKCSSKRNTSIRITIVPDVGQPGREQLRQQRYHVRIAVFHHEQHFPPEAEIEDLTPVGTIRCSSDDVRGYYKLDALAVLQGYRQFHFGRALVLALHDCVRRGLARRGRASATVKAHSQIHATLTESPPLAATISRTQWVTEPLCGADLGIRPRNVLATLHRCILMASSSPLGCP